MKFGLVTQCFLKDNVFKPPTKELNKQTIGNICLKINAKLGGINHVLSTKSKPAVLKRPVMVMGADVSHPAPESRGSKPSIAAIVGSMEPKAANYQVEVRVQDGAQNEEVIHDMRNVTKNLLIKLAVFSGLCSNLFLQRSEILYNLQSKFVCFFDFFSHRALFL